MLAAPANDGINVITFRIDDMYLCIIVLYIQVDLCFAIKVMR